MTKKHIDCLWHLNVEYKKKVDNKWICRQICLVGLFASRLCACRKPSASPRNLFADCTESESESDLRWKVPITMKIRVPDETVFGARDAKASVLSNWSFTFFYVNQFFACFVLRLEKTGSVFLRSPLIICPFECSNVFLSEKSTYWTWLDSKSCNCSRENRSVEIF